MVLELNIRKSAHNDLLEIWRFVAVNDRVPPTVYWTGSKRYLRCLLTMLLQVEHAPNSPWG
jgi:hypothetical protein